MDNKKFEQLIDLIINEDEEQAKDLFHEIVVEKSKEIYESIMEEEMMDDDLEEGMGGQVGDLLDEINAEEEGVAEEEEDEIDVDSEEIFDIDGDEDEGSSSEEVEDAVIRIEDKIDTLMAEFEELMGKEDDLEGRDDEMDADLKDIEDEGGEEVEVDVDADEELVAEAVTLNKVPVQYPHGGDNGENTKSQLTLTQAVQAWTASP